MKFRNAGWRASAQCCNENPDTFFPRGRPSNDSRRPCVGCPVRDECREFALDSPWEPSGIWGGLTERELRPEWERRHEGVTRQTEVHQLLGIA